MRAGKLRRRLMFDRPIAVKTADGEEINQWEQMAVVWASVEPLQGRERLLAGQVADSGDVEISVRWSTELEALTRECRIRDGATIYDVKDKIHIDMARREIRFMATTGITAG